MFVRERESDAGGKEGLRISEIFDILMRCVIMFFNVIVKSDGGGSPAADLSRCRLVNAWTTLGSFSFIRAANGLF